MMVDKGKIVEIKFRPLDDKTLRLVMDVYESEHNDGVAAYGRLISAAMVSAAVLGMRKEQVKQQAAALIVMAKKAVAARTDIFGD